MPVGSVDTEAAFGFGIGDYMGSDTVDEQASDTGMTGPASLANWGGFFGGSPTHSLVMLWFVTLGIYAGLGYFFKGARS